MGAGGEDLIMARAARQKFPFSIECKNVEKLNVWEAYEQAKSNCNDYEPLVVMKKNQKNHLLELRRTAPKILWQFSFMQY